MSREKIHSRESGVQCPGSVDLRVDIGGIRMKNPVMVASGTFGYGPEYADLVNLNQLGAFVVKGIRIDPWEGNPTPRMHEVPGGLLNAIGLQSPGFDVFVEKYLPFFADYDVPVIVNIWGRTEAEYIDIAGRFRVVGQRRQRHEGGQGQAYPAGQGQGGQQGFRLLQ